MRLRISSMNVCVCVCVLSSSGGVQFCSATYRLLKVAPSEQCRDKIMEVQYKGRWVMIGGRGGEGMVGGGWEGGEDGCMEGEGKRW